MRRKEAEAYAWHVTANHDGDKRPQIVLAGRKHGAEAHRPVVRLPSFS
jgi:hypothetical protein